MAAHSWDWVVSSRGERVASANPLHSHPTALHKTVLLNCFQRVLRTGRHISAGRRRPPTAPLVQPNHGYTETNSYSLQLFSIAASAPLSASLTASPRSEPAAALTTNTASRLSGSSAANWPSASRHRLRIVFLRATHPNALEATMPYRPCPVATATRTAGNWKVLPSPKTLSKSRFSMSLRLLGSNLVAALRSAALQNVLAVLRAHAYAEAVRLVAVPVVGLESALHSRPRMRGRMIPERLRRLPGVKPRR